jgi:hypothetical protein
MNKQVTVVLRRPEQIRQGLVAARQLIGGRPRPIIVFLCPGCRSRRACRNETAAQEGLRADCFTDRCDACAPEGFQWADAGRIARIIRDSDIVVPL